MNRFVLRVLLVACLAWCVATAAPELALEPDHASGLYAVGEKIGWTVRPAPGAATTGSYSYTIKRDNSVALTAGKLDLASGSARVETTVPVPAMVYLEIAGAAGDNKPLAAGAAVAPTQLKPVVACPADFDAFWAEKIKSLQSIPAEPVVTSGESDVAGVEYSTVRLNNIDGAHIYGQLAKPARPGKYPAMLLMLWASPPYPFQKAWVTQRAAEGWLALNVEPHDVPGDLPPAFYAALPEMIKKYTSIYNDDRERNYFLRMYLGNYRALDYLASRPDWNGQILLAMGTSMGGQQGLAVAGLHPKVTHLIVHVPAGADSNGELHERQAGYPNWDSTNPKVMQTALYFDTVNFAPRIKATSLVTMGFIDTTCPPAGIWTAFNLIPGRKEVVPLPLAPHNHLATAEMQRAYTERSTAWMAALVHGQEPELRPLSTP